MINNDKTCKIYPPGNSIADFHNQLYTPNNGTHAEVCHSLANTLFDHLRRKAFSCSVNYVQITCIEVPGREIRMIRHCSYHLANLTMPMVLPLFYLLGFWGGLGVWVWGGRVVGHTR